MRRFWHISKFVGLGLLGVVGVALIWLAVANAAANSRVEKKLAELREAGQPLSLSDLARKPIPPETNAATYLRRAKADVEAIQKQVLAAQEAASEADSDALYQGRLTPPIREAIRSALEAHPNAIPLLQKAADCADYDSQMNFDTDTDSFLNDQLDRIRYLRAVVRVLNYQALLLLADEKPEEALRTCLAMLRLARHFDTDPMILNFMMLLAIRSVTIDATNLVLRSGRLPDSAHDALEAELARQDLVEAYRHAIRTERAFGVHRFSEMGNNPLVGYMRLPSGKADYADYLDLMDQLIEAASLPYWDFPNAETRATSRRPGALTRLLVPVIESSMAGRARVEAQIRCLRILNALSRRPPAGEAKFAELGLPDEMLVDPFTGKPLLVEKSPSGWLIYSTGKDLKDDGGQLDDERTDVGLGPVPLVDDETQPRE